MHQSTSTESRDHSRLCAFLDSPSYYERSTLNPLHRLAMAENVPADRDSWAAWIATKKALFIASTGHPPGAPIHPAQLLDWLDSQPIRGAERAARRR